MPPQDGRLASVDALRGFASLAVCWYHLTNGIQGFLPDGLLKASGAWGWMGVEIFFVISGFIIPFTLARAGYGVRDYGTFVLKRIVRLDPPYLTVIALLLSGRAIGIALGLKTAQPVSVTQVLLHLGYANVFFGYPWLNDIFWSLAIELQYYLIIGLVYCLVRRGRPWGLVLLGVTGVMAWLIPSPSYIFRYGFLFAAGLATCEYRRGALGRGAYLVALGGAVFGVYATIAIPHAVAALATALIIAFVTPRRRGVLTFFGDISYSLYLMHAPVGGRIIKFGAPHVDTLAGRVGLIAVALVASVGASYALYRLVERPALRWSSRIRYRRAAAAAAAAPAAEPAKAGAPTLAA